MPIYHLVNDDLIRLEPTTFEQEGISEKDLQAHLRSQIEVISPDTRVVAEEFSRWESSRRIDLLGIDRAANLVVIELKRTDRGDHMELQAIRYAAMVSQLTFEQLVDVYREFLRTQSQARNDEMVIAEEPVNEPDARSQLLEFLNWDEEELEPLGQEVRIVLASADFSKELITSILWLTDNYGLDIRCVRLKPYRHRDTAGNTTIFFEVQTVVPMPEAADYQVGILEKKRQERHSRRTPHPKYDVEIRGESRRSLSKRQMMHWILSRLLQEETYETITQLIRLKTSTIIRYDEERTMGDIRAELMSFDPPRDNRFFCEDGQEVRSEKNIYIITNQWGPDTLKFVDLLVDTFPALELKYEETISL